MNESLALIYGRRSVRSYEGRAVDDAVARELLEAAMAAPSACARDPWRFVVTRNRELLVGLASGLPNGAMLGTAPLGILVCGEQAAAHDGQLSYMLQDCSAAIENMLLAAHGLGLGACWLGVHPREDRIRHARGIMSLPEAWMPVAAIAIGYSGERKPARTRFQEKYVIWK